ncbi:MAG: HPr-rel-A system PqqD family peptide chaperone [Pseudomonadales bacterium]
MTEIWSAPAFPSFELWALGDEAVLFDSRDGRTHYLSPAGAAILAIVGHEALDTCALLSRLETEFAVRFEQEERARLGVALDQLVALELISCSSA